MIHYVDSLADWETVRTGGVLDYARELKAQGVIRAIGLSSHNPEVALADHEKIFAGILQRRAELAAEAIEESADRWSLSLPRIENSLL